jgi:hypothetical protein
MIESTSRVVRVLILLVAVVAALDALRGEHWDQFVMLLAIAVLLATDLVLRRLAPPSITLRPDLVSWLRDEAARTDDTPELVADRAVATYRATNTSGTPSAPR